MRSLATAYYDVNNSYQGATQVTNYEKMTLAELLADFNSRADKPRKSFKSKKVAIEALEKLDAVGPAEEIPAPVVEKPRGRRRKVFVWPVRDEIKPHRPGTKRAYVIDTLTTTGATFEEIAEHCDWDRPTCYEGIKLIHSLLGYGLYEDSKTGVIRAFTDATVYEEFVNSMAA